MSFSFQAEVRADLGKVRARRLRRAEQIPAILYGAGQKLYLWFWITTK